MASPTRVLTVLREQGASEVARRVAERARHRVRLRGEHVWYALELARTPPPVPLDAPMELVTARPEQLDLVGELGQSPELARARLARGHVQWLVLDEGRPVFACWIFRGETPVRAARGGWLELPEGVACLEDSVTSPDYRGRGVAPRVWDELAARLRTEGLSTLVTQVGVENAPSRRAVTKAGFQEVAIMRLDRVLTRTRVQVEVLDGNPTGSEMARRLERTR